MNPQIEAAAQALAEAEVTLQDAQRRHEAALAEVAAVQDRLDAVATRRAKVRDDLASGALDDRQAGSLLALADEDADDLRRLLAEAQARAAAAAPTNEQNALAMAKTSVERIGREIAFEALHLRVTEIEAAFMQTLGALYAQGQALGRGRSLSGIYRPGEELRRVLVHNAAPVGVRHE